MNEKDLLKELEQPIQQPEQVEFENDPLPEAAPIIGAEADTGETTGAQSVNMLQFGQMITSAYCNISDLVYKKIKKAPAAPEWAPEEKESIKGAFEAYLITLNIPMSPLVGLLSTLAMCEVLRYTIKPIPQQTAENDA